MGESHAQEQGGQGTQQPTAGRRDETGQHHAPRACPRATGLFGGPLGPSEAHGPGVC